MQHSEVIALQELLGDKCVSHVPTAPRLPPGNHPADEQQQAEHPQLNTALAHMKAHCTQTDCDSPFCDCTDIA